MNNPSPLLQVLVWLTAYTSIPLFLLWLYLSS